jgi:hypothetical protein
MAHVENQIRKTLEKFLRKFFVDLSTEQTKEVDDLLTERRHRITHLEESIHRHLDVIIGMGSDVLPMIREKVVDIMTQFKDRAKRLNYRSEKLSKVQNGFDLQLEERVKFFNQRNDTWSPMIEEIHELVQTVEDFEIRLGGQTIVISVKDAPQLREKTERVYHQIDLTGYREENRKKILELNTRIGTLKKEEQDRINDMKRRIDDAVSPFVSVLVERIGELNIPRNEIFQEFISVVESVSSVKIEIEEVIPDFDYDMLYANYLQASDEQNVDLLRSIGIQVFPNVDFYQMGVVETKQYLERNYFR